MKSTFLPPAALNLDRLSSAEVSAELMHQYLAQAFLLDLITEEEFNDHAADFKLAHEFAE